MKYSLSFYLIAFSVFSLTKVSAQVSNNSSFFQKPISRFDPVTGRLSVPTDPGLKPLSPAVRDTNASSRVFEGNLPVLKGNKRIIQAETISSNMLIFRPKDTSKMLIAKVDMESPYHYNMPVKKIETEGN